MEESVASEMANGVLVTWHDTSTELVQPLGYEGKKAVEAEASSALDLISEKINVVNGGVTLVSPPITTGTGGTVNGFQLPKDEINAAEACLSLSPPTSSIPDAVGVTPAEVVKRKRGRPLKVFMKKKPLKSTPPIKPTPAPIRTEMSSGEAEKKKRGRPPWKKVIGGDMPLLSSSTTQVSNGINRPSGELPKRKVGRPIKLMDNGDTPIPSSPSTNSAPVGTGMQSREALKRKRGRPWNRLVSGAMVVSSPSISLPLFPTEPVIKKKPRAWKRRSIGAMSVTSPEPSVMGMPSSPSTAPAMIAMEMPSGSVKRKAGRPPKRVIGGAVSLKSSPTSSKPLVAIRSKGKGNTPRTATLQQSTSHETPEIGTAQLPGHGTKQEANQVGVSEPSNSDRTGAQPQTSTLENASAVDMHWSSSLAATAVEFLMKEANLDTSGIGTPVGTVGSREVCAAVPIASHMTNRALPTPGVIPVLVEYEHIYKEIEDRHGRLDNGQSVVQNDTLPYATLMELLSVVQQLKNLVMESVTEVMLASFDRTVTIGRLFNFNVGWLHEHLVRLRGHYEKRCAIDVGSLEQDVERCDTLIESTQDELSRMEAAYVAAKKKVDDLIKSRNDAKAKLVSARHHLKSSEKFPFMI